MKYPIKYHTGTDLFYNNGKLKPEPEETLGDLEREINELTDNYLKVKKQLNAAENVTEHDDTFNLSLCEFSMFNGIDFLEWQIDLKRLHLSLRAENFDKNISFPYCTDYTALRIGDPMPIFEFELIYDEQNELYGLHRTLGPEGTIIPCEMDAIYYVGFWLFRKDGKWGWHLGFEDSFYEWHSDPIHDEIYIPTNEYIHSLNDDDDMIFVVRDGDHLQNMLLWTPK